MVKPSLPLRHLFLPLYLEDTDNEQDNKQELLHQCWRLITCILSSLPGLFLNIYWHIWDNNECMETGLPLDPVFWRVLMGLYIIIYYITYITVHWWNIIQLDLLGQTLTVILKRVNSPELLLVTEWFLLFKYWFEAAWCFHLRLDSTGTWFIWNLLWEGFFLHSCSSVQQQRPTCCFPVSCLLLMRAQSERSLSTLKNHSFRE